MTDDDRSTELNWDTEVILAASGIEQHSENVLTTLRIDEAPGRLNPAPVNLWPFISDETKRAREGLQRRSEREGWTPQEASEHFRKTRAGRAVRALRAVAALHQPDGTDPYLCGECKSAYPCETNRRIMDNLSGRND